MYDVVFNVLYTVKFLCFGSTLGFLSSFTVLAVYDFDVFHRAFLADSPTYRLIQKIRGVFRK